MADEVAPFRERKRVDVGVKPTEALKAEARTWTYNYTVTANGNTYVLSSRYSLGQNDRERQKNLASMLNNKEKSKDLSVKSGGDLDKFKKDFFANRQEYAPPGEERYFVHAEIVPLEVKTVKKG